MVMCKAKEQKEKVPDQTGSFSIVVVFRYKILFYCQESI